MKNFPFAFILYLFSLASYAQGETEFTNKVSFIKTGNMGSVRLVALLPVPVTNEYQEIGSLQVNCGDVIGINEAQKVLFYDGKFAGTGKDVMESFVYKSKSVRIDFDNKSGKNVVTGVDPNEYLDSDGTYIDTENQTIRDIGDQLWSESSDAVDYARRCYEYVASHYRYISGSWRTLSEILKSGGGECGDFTTLFVNLMRYKGIPARHNMGVWVNGGYHVWPDFYDESYGWVPVDPTFKNSSPASDWFGRYDGNLIILSQGLTTFSKSGVGIENVPLQTFYYWYWYNYGLGNINATHETSKDYQVDAIENIWIDEDKAGMIYNLQGVRQTAVHRGFNIVNGRKVFVK